MEDRSPCVNKTLDKCYFYNRPEHCAFEGDSDIAGIGVILAFVISVNLTFMLVVYGLYFVRSSYPEWMLNEVDRMWIKDVNKAVRRFRRPTKASEYKKMYRDVVLIFSDQQLVLGLAILLVGFSQTATITQYHFSIVSNLAYMAFTVHVASIDIIAQDLLERPERRWWRAIGILLIGILALVSVLPYLNQFYLYTYGSPVLCIWSNMAGNSTPDRIVVVTFYVALSIWALCGLLNLLFPTLFQRRPFTWVVRLGLILCLAPRRAYYGSLTRSIGPLNFRTLPWRAARYTTFPIALCTFVVLEILYSEAIEATRNWAFLVANVMELFQIRNASQAKGKLNNENDWGFGQAVPMFLLIIPLLTIFEVYYDVNHRSPPHHSDGEVEISNDEVALIAHGPLTEEPEDNLHESSALVDISTEHNQRSRASATSHDSLDIESRGSVVLRNVSRAASITVSRRPLRTSTSLIPDYGSNASLSGSVSRSPLSRPVTGNPRHYYWDCPAYMLQGESFEDELYNKPGFRIFMESSVLLVFIGVTVAAAHGWAI